MDEVKEASKVETKVESVPVVVEAPKVEAKTSALDVLPTSKRTKEVKADVIIPAPVVETAKVETAQVKVDVTDETTDQKVPVSAVQAERKKRQALQQANLDLQKRLEEIQASQQGMQTLEDPSQQESKLKNSILAISEGLARQTYPDYQEKYDAFQTAVYDGEHVNRPLYDAIIGAENPALAAYEAGKTILFHKKYGTDLDSQEKAIRADERTAMKAELRKELEAEMSGKIAQKLNQPTNLLTTRSAGSGAETPFRPMGIADLIAGSKRRS